MLEKEILLKDIVHIAVMNNSSFLYTKHALWMYLYLNYILVEPMKCAGKYRVPNRTQ